MDEPRIVDLPRETDGRGSLTYVEEREHVPFDLSRVFYIYDMPAGTTRGNHAHETTEQLIVAVEGRARVTLRTAEWNREYRLDARDEGLYVPPKHWTVVEELSDGGVLLVLASEGYDPDEYITNFDEL